MKKKENLQTIGMQVLEVVLLPRNVGERCRRRDAGHVV
jgi:hypothetical protein